MTPIVPAITNAVYDLSDAALTLTFNTPMSQVDAGSHLGWQIRANDFLLQFAAGAWSNATTLVLSSPSPVGADAGTNVVNYAESSGNVESAAAVPLPDQTDVPLTVQA